uniref:Uncharacterized protein n=1 Tax=Prymnesium polylepis TaxID=72548 RepID=A0A7S4J235_9EUKA
MAMVGSQVTCGSGVEVAGQRGAEVHCARGTTLQMPPTATALPVQRGHQLRIPGGLVLVEVPGRAAEKMAEHAPAPPSVDRSADEQTPPPPAAESEDDWVVL